MNPKRRMLLAVALLVLAVAALAGRVMLYTPVYRQHLWSRMSLDEQLHTQGDHVNDPIFLYHVGRKLNNRGEFSTADAYLARAAGLDPDAPEIRDQWAKALMGHGRITIAFGMLSQFAATHPHAGAPALLLGKFYVSREDWRPAATTLERATQLDSRTAETWSLLARVRIKMGRYADAQTALRKAIQLDPKRADNYLQLAMLLASGNSVQARQQFLRAIELAPQDPMTLRQFGGFLLDHGDAAGAERQARGARAHSAQDMLANLLLGQALAAQSRWREAASALEEADRLAPYDPQPAEQLRRVYRNMAQPQRVAVWDSRYTELTRYQNERRRLQDATQANPKNPLLHHQLALALARIGDVNGCAREEAYATRTTPDNSRTLTAAAQDLDQTGHSAVALPVARQAAQELRNPSAQETLANVLLHLGRLHEAAIRYEMIRDWNADKLPEYRRRLAVANAQIARSQAPAEKLLRGALRETDADLAETMLTQAVGLEPENTRCLRALLRLQFARHKTDQAIATAARLASLSPEDGVAHTFYVAARLIAHGDGALSEPEYQDLNRHLQAATRDFSVAAMYYYDRGVIALKRGEARAAVGDLRTAERLEPKSVAVVHWLAQALTAIGDTVGAEREQAKFAQLQREQAST